MQNRRNPVKKNLDKLHKPKTHSDKVKAYRKQKARDKEDWNLDDELYEVEKKT
jgi:hypothetical protein|tara:strand:+ start:437 stop:595 length:159 start_codon:yes stop_codon:yes gene_type:complete